MANELLKDAGKKKKAVSYLIYTAATAAFIAVVYMIFSPSAGVGSAGSRSALNSSLPEGESEILPDSKAAAYEDLAQLNNTRMRGLGVDELNVDLARLNDSVPAEEGPESFREREKSSDGEAADAVAGAKQAAKMLQQGGSGSRAAAAPKVDNVSAEQRQRDPEAERRRAEREELRKKNEQAQELLMQMLQSQQQGQKAALAAGSNLEDKASESAAAESVTAIPDNQGDIATTLGSRTRRSGGFYGMSSAPVQRNGIKACVYGEHTIGDGQHLRIRLLEPMMVSGQVVSAGSVLVGMCKIGADRLLVSIASIEYGGIITRVALEVYDNDGQQGLYVPGSMEMEAGREIGADIASSVGSTAASQTSMFTQQSAAEQIKSEVGRGVIQGTFRFLGRKLQEVKVTVQDKHKIFLVSQK
jgi:conjugative transposon TraM protein